MLQETSGPFWARFDANWYRQTYAADLGAVPDDLATWYLDHGQALGHSPNPWFDETWYRQTYPDVVAAMRRGDCDSGFDAYCRGGFLDRTPHWLFDLAVYQRYSPGLTIETLLEADFQGHYDHFLKHGATEQRIAHLLFDAATYLDALDDASRAEAEAIGPWCHYVRRLPAAPEPATSPYFRPDWYSARYPDAAAQIAAGDVYGALHHYLTNEAPTAYDPLDAFSEAFYLHRFPDIHEAVRHGDRRNGYAHFLADGVFELRQPSALVDLRYYVDTHPVVGRDLDAGRVRDAFAHYLLVGEPAGLPASPPAAGGLPNEAEAKALFRSRAALLLPLLARAPLDFTVADEPAISVVMVLRDQFALTMQALASLRQNFAGDIELLLVDSGSSDETLHLRRYVMGARLLRFDLNIGYVRGCNAALYSVTAPHVLFLNNDIELAPGAIAAALRRLADPTVGAVGARIVRAHGLLQEAGGIVWRDGSTAGYLRDAVPLAPEANFVRDVDYCSAAFLMVRGELLQKLEGFDVDYAPAYFEDADLCLRIIAEGARVVYDPAVTVHHLEYGSSNDADAGAQMLASRAVFIEKHAEVLARRYPPDTRALLFARARDANRRRLLFIEDTVPARRLGSGFVRANDIITLIAGLGLHVTVFPINGIQTDVAGAFADLPDTVEVMHDHSIDTLPGFLAQRQNYYDTIWIARTHNLDRSLGVLQPWLAAARIRPRVVLDTEAVASLRAAEHAMLVGDDDFAVADALAAEFRNAALGDAFVAVTEQEAETLRAMDLSPVSVIGHVRELSLTPRPFAERAGMLFVGAIHAMDSPNYDSLCWFIDEVLPLIEAELGWETRLTVIGHTAPGVSLERFSDHARVTLRGSVPDVRPAYDSHRVFLAPTRYAAGAAYKVHESASFGLPVVASELIRTQLGWDNGQDLLSASTADPAAFAAAVLRVYRSPELWEHLRSGAAGRILAENERPAYEAALQEVLAIATPGDNVMPFPRALRTAPI
jgi:GT2 family glycosyltransferase